MQDNLSEYGSQYLSNIPDADRTVVSKYVGDWDKGVTAQFEDRAAQLAEYSRYGTPEQISGLHDLQEFIGNDPVGFLDYYRNQLMENAENLGIDPSLLGDPYGDPGMYEGEEDPDLEGIPPELVQEIMDMRNELTDLRGGVEADRADTQAVNESAMLDSLLGSMHDDFGDFDDSFVVGQLAQNATPEQALQAWETMRQGIIDSSRVAPPPPLMSGEGGTPSGQVDTSKLQDPKYRKQVGVNFLKQANAANR